MKEFIEIIEPEHAEEDLTKVYDHLVKTRGKLAEVHKIHSLNPESLRTHIEFYMVVMFGNSPLSRAKREMMAVVVSSLNDCNYCVQHHAIALNHFWKDDSRISRLTENYSNADLNAKELLLCQYAETLTRYPSKTDESLIQSMKLVGITDREILDAALVISYFNFVNRMVLGLGVQLEDHKGDGFIYQ